MKAQKGNIRRRSASSFAITIDTGKRSADGKRLIHHESIKGTQADAERRLRALVVDLDRGELVEESRLTLEGWLTEWLTSTIEPHKRRQTAERYEVIIRKNITPSIGKVQLSKLSRLDLQRFFDSLSGTLAPGTIKLIHRVLSTGLLRAVELEIITSNPAKAVKLPPQKKVEVRIPTTEDVMAMLDLARQAGDRLYPAMWLTAFTGMRRGEVMGLQWHNVNLLDRHLSVEDSLVGRGARMHVESPKTERGQRSIDLDDATIAVLEAHRAEQDVERDALGRDYDNKGRVFANKAGDWTCPEHLMLAVKKYGAMVGWPTMNVHTLRHFHISVMLQAKVNIVVVSARAGHATPAFTYSRYAHQVTGAQREAVDAFTTAMGGNVGRDVGKVDLDTLIRHES